MYRIDTGNSRSIDKETMNRDSKYLVNRVYLNTINNRQEQRVIAAMRKLIPEAPDYCGCRICTEDVYAAALSKIPAQYVPNGSFMLRKEGPTDEDIEQIVLNTIDLVRAHPNHTSVSEDAR